MGNVDLTGDAKLMARHTDHIMDFRNQTPLFNIEDVRFPLSTKGIKIVDATGRRVKLAGGNLSGAHMCRHCVDGLECRPLRDIAMDIRYKFKMNCIRLTYSLQMFYDDKPIPEKYLKANPELIGKTGMEIFDITIATLTEVGLMVILNNHTSSSQWCCSNDDGDGLWWSYEFPEYKFFESCEQFAKRYAKNPRVIGMDLRNQLRKANGLETTWGDGNPLTDWHRAATICGQKVLKIAPHWLIFVSGVNYQLDLTGVQTTTIHYSVPNKLVYTGHFYGFSWPIPSWSLVSYEDFKKRLFNSQTFVRAMGYPYFMGEFGNNCQDIPWNYLMKYLKETDIDWTYWALDGFKCQPQKDQTYGVFCNQFRTARNPHMLQDMISTGPPPGTIIEPPGVFKGGMQRKHAQIPQQRKEILLQKQAPRDCQQQNYQGQQQQQQPGIGTGIGNIEPKFLLSGQGPFMRSQDLIVQGLIPQQQGIQLPQQIETRGQAQYLQRPLTQQLQPPQYQNYTVQGNQPQVAQNNQNQGFTGASYVPMSMQTSVSRQTNQPPPQGQQYQPNPQYQQNQTNPQYQQYQPNPQFQQYQPNVQQNQPNQLVRGLLPTGGNQPSQQNQTNNPQKVVYFDSNGRPILR